MDLNIEPVLVVDQLTKHYLIRRGVFQKYIVKALENVSFSVKRGRTLAVVGESGCGKSTLARQLVFIDEPTSGEITVAGKRISSKKDVRQLRQHVQMVFQNPIASLNPRRTVGQTLSEPLKINAKLSKIECRERVFEFLGNVGLNPEYAERYPHMLSGGQLQRIAIARAMILHPKVLVADEPVSALDVSVQAQIINLFMDLQERFCTSYVFISHNLGVVEHIADDVMVMYLGRIVELGLKKDIFAKPLHPYTRILMSCTPVISPRSRQEEKFVIAGEPPSPLSPPSGCAFHKRCPYAVEQCERENPTLRRVHGRKVSCHRIEEID